MVQCKDTVQLYKAIVQMYSAMVQRYDAGHNCGFCERPGGVSPIYQNVSDQTQLLRNDDDQWLEMMMMMIVIVIVFYVSYQNVSNQLGWKICQTCGKVSTSYRKVSRYRII